MPELPEIEHLRRTLRPRVLGRRVAAVTLARHDVLRDEGGPRGRPSRLLRDAVVTGLLRHGKQLALVGDTDAVVCVHLGMSGQVRWLAPGERLEDPRHVHCTWRLEDDHGPAGRLVFRDPRRFGGLWTFRSVADLRRRRWARLGPDALGISASGLRTALTSTRRPVKAALLDQALVAGLGNIYVDEALHAAGIHPLAIAGDVPPRAIDRLATRLGPMLRAAIRAGGTTLRDYVDADGRGGRNGRILAVYGRSGLPCVTCGKLLRKLAVAQRTTVACSDCQALFLK